MRRSTRPAPRHLAGTRAAPLDGDELQARALAGASWTMINVAISLPVAFIANIVVAQALGVAGYGRLAFLMAALGVVAGIIEVGTTSALIQFGAKAHSRGDQDAVAALLSRTQGFRLLIVCPALTVFVLMSLSFDSWLMAITVLFGVWMPSFLGGALDCLNVENKSAGGAKVAIVVGLVTQVFVVTAALAFHDPEAVWVARLVVASLAPALAFVVVAPAYRRASLLPRFPRGFPAGFWRFAIPTAIAGTIGGLVVSRSEVFLLQWLSTPEAVGVFALAYGLASHVFAPADAMTNPLIPAISGLHETAPDRVRPAFLRVTRVASFAAGLAIVCVAPAVCALIPLIYGTEFTESAPVLAVLVIGAACTMLAGPVTTFVFARLSARHMLLANLLALAVDAVVALATIPTWGVWGAVAANVAAAVVRLAYLVSSERSALGLSWREASTPFGTAALAGTVVVAVYVLAERTVGPGVPAAAIGTIAAIGLLLLGIRVLKVGLTAADFESMARALPGPLRRFEPVARRIFVHAPS